MSNRDAISIAPVITDEKADVQSGVSRRAFVQSLGAGLLIAVTAPIVSAQARGRGRQGRGRGGPEPEISARLHIGKDGVITVLTGKVECGQGARAELTQAAAEELRVPPASIVLVMADTALVPDDGITAGSGSTPRTVPAIRRGAAAARRILIELAASRWKVDAGSVDVRAGKAIHAASGRELSYADLANAEDAAKAFSKSVPPDVSLTEVKEWKVLGTPVARPNGRDLVIGAHHYPSDIIRPGMLRGKILRPPSYGAKLVSLELGPIKALKDVTVVQEGSFIGVAAPTSFAASQALEALAASAKWDAPPHPSSKDLFEHLKKHARELRANPFAADLEKSAKILRQSYRVAYIQHAPLEPRAAVAEWNGDALTVWTGTQNPFGCRGELARAFNIPPEQVRVIVPDFGGGFGGKHTGECAVEAARLAKAAGRPVALRWTREEEFTWAYFRPAGLIEVEAGLEADGSIASWYFININSGPNAIESPYRAGKSKVQFVPSDPPLRHGSYRGLASTANTFAREVAIDELAILAGKDPLEFRLAHLQDTRVRGVLELASAKFNWTGRSKQKPPNTGIGLACGTEKGAFVAACALVEVDREKGKISVRHVTQAFDCGTVMNPDNLLAQVQGAIIMGLGPALREEMRFEGGKILNASFAEYKPPRFADVPTIDVHFVNQPDVPSSGAGETPLIAIAPAIANAVFNATGERVREMPIRLPKLRRTRRS